MKMDFFESFRGQNDELHVVTCVILDKFTTLRVGGAADYFAEPESEEHLLRLLKRAKDAGIPVLLMGNGSNLLVKDGGFRGLVIRLGKSFSKIERTGNCLYAQAGALLSALARQAQEASLTGLEFAQGIPGSVGGGVYMNAGAYGGELAQTLAFIRVFDGEIIRDVPVGEMDYAYRHSRAMEENWIILGAQFHLTPGDPETIEAAMRNFASRRREKQPLEYPSAGSFFKRPAGHFAGVLIEGAGLKGLSVGGAQVSEKHAGFLINTGGATAADFLSLMEQVQSRVMEKYGVALEPEVRIVGEEP
ncbi:MAG: UDP-N-acetylmuramate dehydrogenase [Clostridia bacterium]|nr:UDP-N-acetylmuramate dehydrogenase [Clostridia bacterium]